MGGPRPSFLLLGNIGALGAIIMSATLRTDALRGRNQLHRAVESAGLEEVDDFLTDQIFDFMVGDFSRYALELHSTSSTTPEQAEHCLKMIQRPNQDSERFDSVWKNHVMTKVDAYSMTP